MSRLTFIQVLFGLRNPSSVLSERTIARYAMAAPEMASLKKGLRKTVLSNLRAISPEQRAVESHRVLQHLKASPWYLNSQHISVFVGLNDEVDTLPIIEDIFARGRACYIPRYDGAHMTMLRVHNMDDLHSLPRTKWNIPQPASPDGRDDPVTRGTLDLVLTPGVAFTRGCDRLGRGAGYYDKYFESMRASFAARGIRSPSLVALALSPQIVDSIPTTPKDVRLDAVITPDGILDAGGISP